MIAWDLDKDIIYLVNEYHASKRTPDEHAPHINALNNWCPVAWPHDGLNGERSSGIGLAQQYRDQNVNMMDEIATHEEGGYSVEVGISEIFMRMKTGRFKVFRECEYFIRERRQYQRKDGIILKQFDDMMDAVRYAVMMRRFAEYPPVRISKNRKTVEDKLV